MHARAPRDAPGTSARVRVVHVTTVPESLGFLHGQLGFLRDQGFEFVAISSPGPALDAFARTEQIETISVPMTRQLTPLADLQALARLVRVLRRLRPTIVHAHTPKGGMLGVLAGVLAGVPVRIYHLRGLPMLTATAPRRTLLRWAERLTCAAATSVIAVGASLRSAAIAERLVSAEKIEVLGNGSGQGVDAGGRFDPDRLAAGLRDITRDRFGIPRDALVIGFLGRLVRDKGVGELTRAFDALARRHPGLHLIVAGSGEARDAIAPETLRALKTHPRVHLVGFLGDVPALYAASDIIALPTYREGFPNVPLEAAAMRKPIVATTVTGCTDAVVDGATGLLVPPANALALERALERYLLDPALRAKHGDAGRARVVETFSREAIWAAIGAKYVELTERAPRSLYQASKRALDVATATGMLTVLAAPMAAIGAAVAINMGRPAIFAQLRPGKDERLFRLYKFRTMTNERDARGELLPDAQRLTRLGAFLRRTSLDELPELFNVLKGEMSLVGPRPLLGRYLPHFTERERLRHAVPPGITGWAQLHGRNTVSWDERLALDVWYVLNRTLRLDLAILLGTVRLVLRREGVVVDPRSTMLDFDEERARGPMGNHRA